MMKTASNGRPYRVHRLVRGAPHRSTIPPLLGFNETLPGPGAGVITEILGFEQAWTSGREHFPAEPVGYTVQIAARLLERYFPE